MAATGARRRQGVVPCRWRRLGAGSGEPSRWLKSRCRPVAERRRPLLSFLLRNRRSFQRARGNSSAGYASVTAALAKAEAQRKSRHAFRGCTGNQGTRGEVRRDGPCLCSLAPRPRLRAPAPGCPGAVKVAPERPSWLWRARKVPGTGIRVEAAAFAGGGFFGKVNVWCFEVGFAVAPGVATLPGGVRSAVQ